MLPKIYRNGDVVSLTFKWKVVCMENEKQDKLMKWFWNVIVFMSIFQSQLSNESLLKLRGYWTG